MCNCNTSPLVPACTNPDFPLFDFQRIYTARRRRFWHKKTALFPGSNPNRPHSLHLLQSTVIPNHGHHSPLTSPLKRRVTKQYQSHNQAHRQICHFQTSNNRARASRSNLTRNPVSSCFSALHWNLRLRYSKSS